MSRSFSGASWIASSLVGGAHAMTSAPYFRKTWQAAGPVRSARLYVTALGLYEVEINGQRVGNQIFAPGWTDYRKRVQYQIHDVTALVRKGENVIGAILGDGWYCGYIAHLPRQFYGDRPRFLARLEVELKDGTRQNIVTDSSWKTATGPILQNDMLMGEAYDARLELGAWSSPKFDDHAWTHALVLAPEEVGPLVPSQGPPVRRIAEKRFTGPTLRYMFGDMARTFDLGQNLAGRVRLKVRAPRGTVVTLRFAEMLNANGTLNTQSLRRARAIDYYTCKGEGTEIWEPRFTFHGFRYVEVSGVPKEYSVELTGIVLHSDMPTIGHFACSHSLVNQLQSNIVWSQRSNFLEVPTDCPQRDERMGWTGDAQIFVRTAAFNMDVRNFFHKWMQDVRDIQAPEGGINCTAPDMNRTPGDCGPGWADAIYICPWTIYLCYGDKQILADNYDAMVRNLEFIAKSRTRDYIRCHPAVDWWGGHGDWLALDGSGSAEGATPKDLIGTAYYAYSAGIMAQIAEVLGKKKDAVRFRSLRVKIVSAFQKRFVTSEGLLASGTQTAYIMALHFGLLPESLRDTAAGELVRDIKRRGYHLSTGFLGTPHILDVLEENGHLEVAYKLLEQETFPSWLFPVKNGATTIWERWDGWTLEKGFNEESMSSFNHYAYGAVGAWMVRTVAGLDLDPEKPGYRHIIFRPRPGGTITWAEASLETPQGKAAIHWKKTKQGRQLVLTVPKGSSATLHPPDDYGASRTFRPGHYRLTLRAKTK